MEDTVIKFRNYIQIFIKNLKEMWEKYRNVSKRNLIMSCRASWSSLTSALWNLCPQKKQTKQPPEKVLKEEFGRIGYYKSNVF